MNPSQTLVKELESTQVARFQDCDPFGHLNNARYIDYFLNARQDQVQARYGLRIYQPDHSASWVVRKTHIAYIRPVNMMEEFLVRTRLIQFDETSLMVEGLMLDLEGRNLKSLAWFDFVYVSLVNGRPVRHPEDLMDLFRSVAVTDGYDPNGFNRRVETARRQTRKPAAHEANTSLT
jgi:acyl-CoA thioester hydrolase